MKYAIVNVSRVEAVKGAKGICPGCRAEVVAKCGDRKVHHWAHKGNRNCDLWWEPETEWHRMWKGNYSADWQEFPMRDEVSTELHIADVRTSDGLVIEFQNSPIHPDERRAREAFYKNMVWVINAARLKGDYPRFCKAITGFRRIGNTRVYRVSFAEECFPKAWIDSGVPVIFDFKVSETIHGPDLRNSLYCLLPKTNNPYRVLVQLSFRDFVALTISGQWSTLLKTDESTTPQGQVQAQSQTQQLIRPRRASAYYYDRRGRLVQRKRL